MQEEYELEFRQQGRDVRGLDPAHALLDFDDLLGTFAQLDRHLIAACAYAGEAPNHAHLFEVTVYRTRDQRRQGGPVLRYRMPVDEQEARRWR